MRLTILITFAVFVLIALVIAKWILDKGRREIERNRVPPPDTDIDTEPKEPLP